MTTDKITLPECLTDEHVLSAALVMAQHSLDPEDYEGFV